MSILDFIGGFILTCILVIFLVVLLKIIRIVIIDRATKETDKEHLESDEGEKNSTTPISEGASDPTYWHDAKPDEAYVLPSPVHLSYSVKKPIILRANHIGVFGKNGSSIAWIYNKPEDNNNIQDDKDPKLFKLHYFDLKNFEPLKEDMVKPHWERDKSYVVLECASGGFMHSDMSKEYPSYGLDVTFSAPTVTQTRYTDDRFFSVHKHYVEDGVKHLYLKHLASDCILSTGDGAVKPIPKLKFLTSEPSDIELFFFEDIPTKWT